MRSASTSAKILVYGAKFWRSVPLLRALSSAVGQLRFEGYISGEQWANSTFQHEVSDISPEVEDQSRSKVILFFDALYIGNMEFSVRGHARDIK